MMQTKIQRFATIAPLGYVNTSTGQFFKDVEPCRKNNQGHWRTVYESPKLAAAAATDKAAQDERLRSEAEIVRQTETLARLLMGWRWEQEPERPGINMRDSGNSRAQECWAMACKIQEHITGADVENAVAEIEGEEVETPVPTPCRSMFGSQKEYADAMEAHRKQWAELREELALPAAEKE